MTPDEFESESEIEAKIIGAVIEALREERGMRQAALAKRLDVPQSRISRIEAGDSVPDAVMIRRLAGVFGMSAAELNELFEEAIEESARRGAQNAPSEEGLPWWQAAAALAGAAGVVALIGFAVGAALKASTRADED